jgi:hypothetical protein
MRSEKSCMRNQSPRALLRAFARTSPPLLVATLAGLALLAVSLVGLVVDPRTITGVPAWLKPAKFGISIAIYCATFAWFLSFLRDARPRLVRTVGWVFAVAFLVEILAIGGQAARGTTSHFNVATPYDDLMFSLMGTFIMIMWLSAALTTWALFRTPMADRAMGTAIRWGLVIMLAGSLGSAIPMLTPRPEQIAEFSRPDGARVTGAHTVGAPDGGPGMPVTNWSTEHGDLRVGHFVALHSIQILPMVAALLLFAGRPASATARARLVGVAAVSLGALISLLTWQAMQGEPLVHPSGRTLAAFGVWALATIVAGGVAAMGRSRATVHAAG